MKSNDATFRGGGIGTNPDSISEIVNTAISGNTAVEFGGGIRNFGTLNITNGIVDNDSAGDDGGVILNFGDLKSVYTYLAHNQAAFVAGIGNLGDLTILRSTINNNIASVEVGGIGNPGDGSMVLMNSTLSGNNPGGISSSGFMGLINSTIADKKSEQVIPGLETTIGSDADISNTIIANNTGRDYRLDVPLHSFGHNLDSDGSCGLNSGEGDLSNTDPLLGPL